MTNTSANNDHCATTALFRSTFTIGTANNPDAVHVATAEDAINVVKQLTEIGATFISIRRNIEMISDEE